MGASPPQELRGIRIMNKITTITGAQYVWGYGIGSPYKWVMGPTKDGVMLTWDFQMDYIDDRDWK
jgi:hypothetical protein